MYLDQHKFAGLDLRLHCCSIASYSIFVLYRRTVKAARLFHQRRPAGGKQIPRVDTSVSYRYPE